VDGRPSGLVQQGYLHPAWTGDGHKEMEPFREICHGIEVMREREREERGRERVICIGTFATRNRAHLQLKREHM